MNTSTDRPELSELRRLASLISAAVDSDRWDELQQQLAAFDNLALSTRFTAKDKSQLLALIEGIESARKQAEARQIEIGNLLKAISTAP